MIKSFSALLHNGILFFIFLYLFAVIGVSVFRLPDHNSLPAAKQEVWRKKVEAEPNKAFK